MSTLSKIKDVVQQFAEATSAALKIDVEVIDDDRIRIAGTGLAKEMIGNQILQEGIINRNIFGGKKKVIVDNPGIEENCIKCPRYGKCLYKKAVYSAIEFESKTIGVIGIYALSEEQSKLIEYNGYAMLEFVEKIAELIGSKVQEYEMMKQVKTYAELMNSVVDNIDKGVVILNKDYQIVCINNYLIDKLMIKQEAYTSKHINELFPSMALDSSKKNNNREYQEIQFTAGIKELFLLCKLKTILINQAVEAHIFLIEDYTDTNQLAYAVTDKQNTITLQDIWGENEQFVEFKKEVKAVASHESTVLLTGETGTGKELFARAIHYHSNRRGEPFVAINCGALPETLIETELFGYEKGAFTGASNLGKHGKFYLANKGTIFLDEIETMPIYLQPKLLRVLERREVERIGGVRTIPVDIRIIAATNVRLDVMVERGLFREDLFHRLNVVSLFIPPLRNRGNDVLVLADNFIEKYSDRFHKKVIGLSNEVKNIFSHYAWPGNIRELQNTIEYAINMATSAYVEKKDLPFQFTRPQGNKETITLDQIEKRYIINALNEFGWNEEGRILAAKKLGISRATIYRRIKTYDLTNEQTTRS